MKIKELFKNKKEQKVNIKGWVINNRGNNKIRFITINDGSHFSDLQIVIKNGEDELDSIKLGTALNVDGEIILTPDAKQPFELIASKVQILKQIDEDYPLQKKETSREVLRDIPHLRVKTNLFRSVMRIRSTLLIEIHNFFNDRGFLNVSSPIITGNDGEGAGEAFVIDSEEGNFFGKKATLGVTGQLHAEAYANAFGDVYTFAPTFRAENSHTQKHAAEFWMIEPEMAFKSKEDGIKLADDLLKQIIKNTLNKHKEEFDFLEKNVSEGLREKLNLFLENGVQYITYSDAIKKLQEVKNIFKVQDIEFGLDLGTEHEKYLAEVIFKGPVAVTDYPKEIKAFYMKQNIDDITVAAFDVLVPGIGELVGGSERETNYKKIINKVKEMNIPLDDLKWYIDLRRFGQAQSTGFGLGFERLIMYVTGIENIRDTIPFPRTPNNMKM